MYLINRQLHPPTTIDGCIYAHFYGLKEKQLITCSTNQIKIFRLITEGSDCDVNDGSSSEKKKDVKLECLQTFSLFGRICDIKPVTLPGASRDSILVCFHDAKLSIIEYDPTTHGLRTVALHYFEKEEMKCGRTQFPPPILRVDPEGRCAALLVYGQNVVIIPFKKELAAVLVEEHLQTPSKSKSGSKSLSVASYQLNLQDEAYTGEKINNIVDMEFLEGYYEPTLLILHEPIQTWPGRLAVRNDTFAMVTLSLNILQKVHPIIWSLNHLPYDCLRVLPVPKPIGGVLLFAVNSLIYLNQSMPPYAVTLNGLGEGPLSSAFSSIRQRGVQLSLDASQACFISYDKLVISLKGGDLYVLTLFNDGMGNVRKFYFEKAASSVMTSCITPCEPGYLFLGSRLGNSLLLKYTEKPYVKPDEPKVIEIDESERKDEEETEEREKAEEEEEKEGKEKESKEEEEEEEESKEKEEEEKESKEETEGSESSKRPLEDEGEEPLSKVLKMDEPEEEEAVGDIGDWLAKDVALMKQDDLEVYGDVEDEEEKLPTSFSFEVCDSVSNVGPCSKICMGQPAFLAEEFHGNSTGPHIELLTTSGFGKNGALSLIHRTVRPQVVTTFNLPDCSRMWTVKSSQRSKGEDSSFHSFLILSKSDSTMILQTGKEINELEENKSGFSSRTKTIFTGNVGQDRFIIQVTPSSVVLLEDVNQIQYLSIDHGSPIIQASSTDPFTVTLTKSGQVYQYQLTDDRLHASRPSLSSSRFRITNVCLYKDVSGLFTTQSDTVSSGENESVRNEESTIHESVTPSKLISTVDEEDELLYGDSTVEDVVAHGLVSSSLVSSSLVSSSLVSSSLVSRKVVDEESKCSIKSVARNQATYWLFLARENGVVEVYSVPEYRLCYYIKNFPMTPKVVSDGVQGWIDGTGLEQSSANPKLEEMVVVGLGAKESRPILFARFTDQLVVYEAFAFHETQVEGHLKLRFKKLESSVLLKKAQEETKDDGHRSEENGQGTESDGQGTESDGQGTESDGQGTESDVQEDVSKEDESDVQEDVSKEDENGTWLHPFSDVSGYSGLFLSGSYPTWFMMTSRGELRQHEMSIDGSVKCFAPFHNMNCTKGFLYFNENDDLRISILPTQVSYDAYWPLRKVPLRSTVHFINYHIESKCYIVVTSVPEKVTRLVKVASEEKDYELLERDDRYIWPTRESFSIQLFSPVSWEVIPGTKLTFEEWEHVTCIKNVSLVTEGTESGLKGYIAVGTNYCYGEDVTNRGRIWILDIIEVVPEPGQPLTKNKIKMVYQKEQKGPVTTLCQVKGFLLSAIGQKIYVWQLKDDQLVGVAFIDTQIYIHSAVSIKNLVLVADIFKSISLLRYQEETRTLALVARDTRSYEVFAAHFVVDSNQLCFVLSDSDSNLIVYAYNPELRESFGGTRLIRRADFHLGSRINTFFRIKAKPFNVSNSHSAMKQLTVYATLDGGLGYILPIVEKTYRRLLMLQNVMTTQIQVRS